MYFCGLVWFCGSILISRGIFVCFATFVWPRVWSPAVCRHGFLQAKTFFTLCLGLRSRAAVALATVRAWICGCVVGLRLFLILLCDFSGRRCGRVCLVFAIVCSPIGGRPRSIRAMRGRIDGHVFSISAVAFDCFAIVKGGSCCCAGQICGACLNLRLCLLGFSIVLLG